MQRIAALLHVFNHPRAVSQFRHVKGRDVAQSHFHAFLGARRRDATDRVRRAFGNVGGSVDRIHSDVKHRRARDPRAQLFPFENARRFVLHPFANDDLAADVHQIEHAAHGVARRGVGGLLVAAPEPAQRIQRRRFGRAHKIELDDALDVLVILFLQSQSHGAFIFTQFARDDKLQGGCSAISSARERRRLLLRSGNSRRASFRPAVTVQRRPDTQEKLESVCKIVAVVTIEPLRLIVHGELAAESNVEPGPVR